MTPAADGVTKILPADDRAAVGRTLGRLQQAFVDRDAGLLAEVYSDDADWVNAFGSVKKGRQDIVTYLTGLFADSNFNAGTVTAPPQTAMRVVTDSVVVVSAHLQIAGQKLLDGGAIDVRDNYSIRVLHRQDEGSWLIVSEMFMDANQEQSYVNHS